MTNQKENYKKQNRYFYFFIIIILSVSVIVLFGMLLNMANTAESLAQSLINKTTSEVNDKLENYFDKIKGSLIATKQLCDQGILDALKINNTSAYFLPVFNTYPEVNTIVVANTEGNEFSIIREDSTWLTNVVFESSDSGMVINRELWKGNIFDKIIIKKWTDCNAQYDPRTRPWFIGAMKTEYPEEPWWTEPYIFFTHQIPGITASMRSFCPYTKKTSIIQYDILLSEISEFTISEHTTANSKTFVLTNDLKVIGLPNEPKFNNPDSISKYVLKEFNKIGSGVLESSVNNWKQLGENYSDAFSLEINDEKWWIKISRFELGKNRLFLIGVAVLENDFLSEVNSTKNVVIGGFLIVLIIIIIVIRQYIVKRKMNLLLALQKEQISNQRDEISKQHKLVVEQKKEIEDSIRYAKRIQTAVLPADKYADSILGEHFIVFRPKDVVSGDFYWATQTEEWIIVTAADSTGHGVPGAFMSMLGVSFLNEIVGKKDVTNTGDILNNLRTSIIDALKQTGKEGTQKDGMDMSIVAIHKTRKYALWSGANNPIWIIRNSPVENTSIEITDSVEEIKPDKMPVAIHERMDSFKTHEIQLNPGDKLYLFTDGLPDQFGGQKGKKFLYKRFKEILVKYSGLPMLEQGKQIEKELNNWVNGFDEKFEQIDDITVLGLRI
ncbi:MAG: hypothetical protein A2275_07590 [Bacteroidetes bacterium RIFOXYA12_FULL_35_11]|nr:MAG: hypothetical protein A2X01_00810 [Bacteroidetes bacterium GWF2_35_48]OFY80790.1 MAG: hypothetical protein A2275_07590 [Bacteroidetes bacterium RIFOXYA12_FULL_35_11]OFZ00888.1 MAG: hypothetical protein A2491_01155 [Bacteroidetes bacterium RIFOXYC12_FULL_35_7]HBX50059.1 hypothetical protein [Bacteroidales bacterium]